MPIYEYECKKCGEAFEYLILPSSPVAECPSCKSKDLEKMISLSAVSSEHSRQTNFNAERKKATAVHKDKQHEEHKHIHDHHD
jgi:putative FmdB family regulatory protein